MRKATAVTHAEDIEVVVGRFKPLLVRVRGGLDDGQGHELVCHRDGLVNARCHVLLSIHPKRGCRGVVRGKADITLQLLVSAFFLAANGSRQKKKNQALSFPPGAS